MNHSVLPITNFKPCCVNWKYFNDNLKITINIYKIYKTHYFIQMVTQNISVQWLVSNGSFVFFFFWGAQIGGVFLLMSKGEYFYIFCDNFQILNPFIVCTRNINSIFLNGYTRFDTTPATFFVSQELTELKINENIKNKKIKSEYKYNCIKCKRNS